MQIEFAQICWKTQSFQFQVQWECTFLLKQWQVRTDRNMMKVSDAEKLKITQFAVVTKFV